MQFVAMMFSSILSTESSTKPIQFCVVSVSHSAVWASNVDIAGLRDVASDAGIFFLEGEWF